jgi:aspartate aminotransferase
VKNTTELASRLLQEAHVVTVPGEAFGTKEHIRLSYAVSHTDVDEGLVRMKKFFAALS